MFVIPQPYLTIPDPANGDYLPVDGREVVVDQYWMRRLDCGDVVEKQAKDEKLKAKGKSKG